MPHGTVVILAGGQGSRLRPYTHVLPKPLIPVGDIPILEIVIRQLRNDGFNRIILAVGVLDGLIRSYFGDGSRFGVEILYSKEDRELGTVGPLHLVSHLLPRTFLLMNGDVLTDLDFAALMEHHLSSRTVLTVSRWPRRIQMADGVIETGPAGRLTGFSEKPTFTVWISIGVYAMDRSVLDWIPMDRVFGMDGLIGSMLQKEVGVNTFHHEGTWYDIGSTGDLERATAAFHNERGRFLPDASDHREAAAVA